MATAFSNVGLNQLGQDMSFSGGEGKNLGQFLLGAALAQLGTPKEIVSLVEKQPIAPPTPQTNQGVSPVVSGQTMQSPEDERVSFSKGFGSLFSHLPTFGK